MASDPKPRSPSAGLRSGMGAIGLLWLFPLLRLVAENPGSALPHDRLASYWVLATGLLFGIVAISWVWNKGSTRRVVTFLALSVFSLTYLAVEVRNQISLEPIAGLSGSLLLGVGFVVVAALISRWNWATTWAFVFGVLTCLGPLYSIAQASLAAPPEASPPRTFSEPFDVSFRDTPNIYWFVLDGYGRGDVLLGEFGFSDQDSFLDQLEDRGFTISREAVAAYPMTDLSMASTLAADYVALNEDSVHSPGPFLRMIQGENRVVAMLRSAGYTYAHWASVWSGARCSELVDLCVATGGLALTEIEWTLLSNTPFSMETLPASLASTHADRSDPLVAAKEIFDRRPDEPFFALVHLVNPHPPHFAAGDGCELQNVPYDLETPYREGEYVEALKCLNRRLVEAIDLILSVDEDSIVILQGDHGPGTISVHDSDLRDWTARDIRIRFGVLSAMRVPEGCEPPNDLTLVNTFRVVFDCISSEDVLLLPNRIFLANRNPGDVMESQLP